MMRDKDAAAFARTMSPLARSVYATMPDGPRALAAESLASRYGARAKSVPALADALRIARGEAGPRDVICVTGSLALVGKARSLLDLPVLERLWDVGTPVADN
jgi:dihydrofolate synthase/folylpolyglutamate synthase